MTSKRNPFVFVFFLVLFLLAAGYISYSLFLPRYIEKNILSTLGDQFHTSLSGKVYSIGINEASFGDIVIGDKQNVAGSVGSILAEYSISSILGKNIKNLKINGLTLNLEISKGRIIIPGLDLEKIIAAKSKNETPQHPPGINLPVQFDNFQITNGFFNIQYEHQPILVPFNLQIFKEEQSNKGLQPVYQVHLRIFPQGQELIISGSVDLPNNKGIFFVSADSLDLQPFTFLLGEIGESVDFGRASIKSNAGIELMPFRLIATEIDGELESVNFKNTPVIFGLNTGSATTTTPLRLTIKGNGQQWNVTAHGTMQEPLSAFIDLDGSLQSEGKAAKGVGTFLIRVIDKAITLRPDQTIVITGGSPELRGDFSADISSTGEWQAKIDSPGSKETLDIAHGQNSLNTKIPSFTIQGKGSDDGTQIQVELAIPDIRVKGPDAAEVILPMAKLHASFDQEKKSGQDSNASGGFSLSLADVKIKKAALTGRADILLVGKMEPQKLQDIKLLDIAGEFIVNKAKAEDKESGIAINSIETRIPWQWFPEDREKTGSLKVSGIKWKNNELGSFETGIKLKNAIYKLNGRFSHALLNGLVTKVTGQVEIADSGLLADLALQMDQTPFSSLHLGKLDSSLNNSYLSGELGLDGAFKFDVKGFRGNMDFMMQNGKFEYPEKKYEVKGITLALQLPFLPELRSGTAQKILFDTASIGELTFEQGKIVWQLESTDSIFIEEGVVRWSKGRVFTNAVRISPDRKDFIVPIFCDRLILADILRQFGITNAEGEGTVSGRIPLLIGKGTVHFEDGFLYSSPGQGGSIKVAAFDLLSAGIPKNNPQFTQVDFAAEALKNFKYNWVKLLFNSEGENLVMQMHMDGKPLQSLPFTYDSQTGFMQRVENSSMGIDQPIRLDVNFRLPLNRFLGYSGKIQDMMQKIK